MRRLTAIVLCTWLVFAASNVLAQSPSSPLTMGTVAALEEATDEKLAQFAKQLDKCCPKGEPACLDGKARTKAKIVRVKRQAELMDKETLERYLQEILRDLGDLIEQYGQLEAKIDALPEAVRPVVKEEIDLRISQLEAKYGKAWTERAQTFCKPFVQAHLKAKPEEQEITAEAIEACLGQAKALLGEDTAEMCMTAGCRVKADGVSIHVLRPRKGERKEFGFWKCFGIGSGMTVAATGAVVGGTYAAGESAQTQWVADSTTLVGGLLLTTGVCLLVAD